MFVCACVYVCRTRDIIGQFMKTTEFIFTAKESILIYRKQYLYLGEGHVCRSYAVRVTR